MEKSEIIIGEVPVVEFPDQTKKGSTGDEEEARHHRHQFRNEVARKYAEGGKLPRGTRLISGGSKRPERPNFKNINPDLGQEITIRAHRTTDKDVDIPENYKPFTTRV